MVLAERIRLHDYKTLWEIERRFGEGAGILAFMESKPQEDFALSSLQTREVQELEFQNLAHAVISSARIRSHN